MKRIHSLEFHEWPECPTFIRESIVETLGTALSWGNICHAWASDFEKFCNKAGCTKILDLCSGTGWPVSILISVLQSRKTPLPQFILSDLFPHESSLKKMTVRHPDLVRYRLDPIDASQVPHQDPQTGLMILNAFHHFTPPMAKKILQNATDNRHPIFIHESFPRNILRIFSMLHLLIPAVFLNPFLTKTERFKKLLFTYAFPLIPLLGLWDGLISTLRVHTREEMLEMIRDCSANYEWTYREIPFRPMGKAIIFYGIPIDHSESQSKI